MDSFSPAARTIIVVAAIIVFILGLRELSSVVTPVLLALVIAVIWSAFPAWLRSRGIGGRWTAVVAIFAVLVAVALVGLMVTVSLIQLEERLPTYEERLVEIESDVEDFINDLGITEEPVDIGGLFADEVFSAERLTSLSQTAIEQTFSAVGLAALIFIFSLFMLAESGQWIRKFTALPTSELTDMAPLIERYGRDMRQWLIITFLTGLMVAVPSTIMLMLFDVDFAVLWGFLILVFSYVPSIGFIVSVVPPVAMAYILHGPWVALTVLAIIVVINTIVDNFLKPRIIGRSLNMSPLVMLIGVVFWAFVLGPLGAFLSTPIMLLIRFGLQAYPETQWLARMMGNEILEVHEVQPASQENAPTRQGP